MIIKTTFNDNDYTQVLENYWSKFFFCNYYKGTDKIEDPKVYRDVRIDMEELLEKAIYHENEMTVAETSRFEKYIAQSILEYVKEFYEESYKYLKDNLFVNIRLSITDKSHNGEVVYYFLTTKQKIIL